MDRLTTSARMAQYRAGAVRRRPNAECARREHWERAQRVAGAAAEILRPEFGAKRVFLFGTGPALECFRADCDLGPAVRGVDERAYLRAVARLHSLDPAVSVDLVAMEDVRPTLRVDIQTEGREL